MPVTNKVRLAGGLQPNDVSGGTSSVPPVDLSGSMGLTPTPGQDLPPGATPDADGRGFTNADGGHDWNVGQGPGGDWHGEDQKTGLAPVGTDPGSGDALGIPRGTAAYRTASAAHQAWIEQNRAAGRTLADLGETPTRGGGLSNYMQYAGTPRGTATSTPAPSPSPSPTLGVAPGVGTKTTPGTNPAPTGPQMTTNSSVNSPVPTGPITPTLGTGLMSSPGGLANPTVNTPTYTATPKTGNNPGSTVSGPASPTSSLGGVGQTPNTSPNTQKNPIFNNSMGMGLGGGSLYGRRNVY